MAGVPRNEVISAKSPIAFSPSGLILLRVVGLNGFRLNDDSRVTSGERSAFGGDGACDVARGKS